MNKNGVYRRQIKSRREIPSALMLIWNERGIYRRQIKSRKEFPSA